MSKPWKKEFARDVIALGGIPFYFIVIIRAIIGEFQPFVSHLVLGLVIYYFLSRFIKPSDPHIARGLILLIFISFYYQVFLFTLFATLLWLVMIWAQSTRKIKWNALLGGALLGIISSALSYYITLQIL
tara:strand:- start:14506 stop:14892 length:387 start_codon:yes stop_codon:yes gene_type:complete